MNKHLPYGLDDLRFEGMELPAVRGKWGDTCVARAAWWLVPVLVCGVFWWSVLNVDAAKGCGAEMNENHDSDAVKEMAAKERMECKADAQSGVVVEGMILRRCINLDELKEYQGRLYKQALAENKHYRSEEAGHDVGDHVAELDFFNRCMESWGAERREEFCGGMCEFRGRCLTGRKFLGLVEV